MSKTRRASPPRKARGEPASVTIGNLELQVRNLTTRCKDLVDARDGAARHVGVAECDIADLRSELALEQSNHHATKCMLQECQAKLASTEKAFSGYRRAVVDIHHK